MSLNLKRKLIQGKRIVFGLYSDMVGYVTTDHVEDPDTTNSYIYWNRTHHREYVNQIAYVSPDDFLNRQQNILSDYEMCIYMEYDNEPDGVAYSRSVIGNVVAVGIFTGRRLVNVVTLFSSTDRRHGIALLKSDSFSFSDSANKLLLFIRGLFCHVDFNDEFERKVFIKG